MEISQVITKGENYNIEITHNSKQDQIQIKECNILYTEELRHKRIKWKIDKGFSDISQFVTVDEHKGTFTINVPATAVIDKVLFGSIIVNAIINDEILIPVNVYIKIYPENKRKH